MITSTEIEFKTFLTKEKYEELLNKLSQEGNILKQTNYYFDDIKHTLELNKKVLRIRQKGEQYKLTKKSKGDVGNIENHIHITKDEALKMILNGFDASVIDENIFVSKICELTTYRTKIKYKTGFLFLDKSIYNNKTDYELEYEAIDPKVGKIEFDEILKELNINYDPSYSKFKRALGK